MTLPTSQSKMNLQLKRQRGFTLVEILIVVIILGLLAAIVIPQFGEASITARENMLHENLRMMRMQIGCYQVQHKDVTPGFPNGATDQAPTEDAFISQLTGYTNEQGQTNDGQTEEFCLGPYMSRIPENPINRLSNVLVLDFDADIPDQTETGWIFKPDAYIFLAGGGGLDSQGRPYSSY